MNTLYIFQWVVCEEKMFPNTHGRVLVNDDDPSKVRSKIVQSVHNFLPAPLYGFFNIFDNYNNFVLVLEVPHSTLIKHSLKT